MISIGPSASELSNTPFVSNTNAKAVPFDVSYCGGPGRVRVQADSEDRTGLRRWKDEGICDT
jgi:hypothetical protein